MSALRSPALRLYLFGAFFALNGLWIQRVTLAWLAWSLTGSAAWVGAIAGALYAPTLVAGPVFGVLADRIDLRRGALATQSLMALGAVVLAALWSAGALGRWELLAAALALGTVWSAHHPIRMALVPRLAPKEAVAQAIALGSVNFNVSRMLGPAIAGLLLAGPGPEAALLMNAVCFVPFLAALLLVRVDAGPRARDGGGDLGGDFAEGLRFALRTPTIRWALLGTAAFALIARAPLEITAAIVDGAFGRGAQGLGEATAAAGFGALLASMSLAGRRGGAGASEARRLIRLGAAALLAAGLLGAALAQVSDWGLALVCFALLGLAATTAGVGFQSAVQLSVDDARRGRVMSLWIMLGIGGAAVGAAALGALADAVGLREAMGLLGGVGAAATGAALAFGPGAGAFDGRGARRHRARDVRRRAPPSRPASAVSKESPP